MDRFVGIAEGGKFRPLDPQRLKALLRGWEGKDVEVHIQPVRTKRSLPQNALIHVLANHISDKTGDSVLTVKRRATLEALGMEVALIVFEWQGKTLTDVRGTSELSREEAGRVLDVLLQQADFLEIPRPNPEHYEDAR